MMKFDASNCLVEPRPPTVDPFTRAYWDDEPLTVSAMFLKDQTAIPTSSMNPPRVPLQDRSNFLNGANVQTTINGKVPKASKVSHPKRLVPSDQLSSFKKEIEGSDMTKIALIEHLKKQYATPFKKRPVL
jgi:chromatin assembly factor 1 subunit A